MSSYRRFLSGRDSIEVTSISDYSCFTSFLRSEFSLVLLREEKLSVFRSLPPSRIHNEKNAFVESRLSGDLRSVHVKARGKNSLLGGSRGQKGSASKHALPGNRRVLKGNALTSGALFSAEGECYGIGAPECSRCSIVTARGGVCRVRRVYEGLRVAGKR